MNEKFGRDDDGREKTGGGIEKTNPRLLSDVGDMSEIPCDEIIDLVKRRQCDMYRIGDIFSVKNTTVDIALGEYRHLLG